MPPSDPNDPNVNPARRLTGLRVADGWEVGTLIPPTPSGTGAHHSFSYHVYHQDHGPAFLKALNTEAETGHTSHADRIKFLFDLFIFERDLLTECKRVIASAESPIYGRLVKQQFHQLAGQPSFLTLFSNLQMETSDNTKTNSPALTCSGVS